MGVDVQPTWLDFVRSTLMPQSCMGQAVDDDVQLPRMDVVRSRALGAEQSGRRRRPFLPPRHTRNDFQLGKPEQTDPKPPGDNDFSPDGEVAQALI